MIASISIMKEKESVWHKFKDSCNRKGLFYSEVILGLVQEWLIVNGIDSPQQDILNYTDESKELRSTVEGHIKQICLDWVNYTGNHAISKRKILQIIRSENIMGQEAIHISKKIENWLKEKKSVVVYH